jgi:hypothetical protein
MKAGSIFGGILIVLGVGLISLSILGTTSIIIQILGVLNIILPFLSGRKIARYLHDFSVAKEKGLKFSPMAMVYMWLFFWILFLIFYSIAMFALSITFKFVLMRATGGALTGILGSVIIFIGAFYLFRSRVAGRGFVTSWGKRVERMNSMHSKMAKEMVNEPLKVMGGAKNKMKKFMP